MVAVVPTVKEAALHSPTCNEYLFPKTMHVNIPGLGNSDENHWQSIWEKKYPASFIRVEQADWRNPDCHTWTTTIEKALEPYRKEDLVLVGHSVGCSSIVHWYNRYRHRIKGALLVAPSDVDKPGYPSYITGFSPMPLNRLPFPSIVVASTNDHVVNPERAGYFASCWGSELVVVQDGGHLESKSGYGNWDEGLELLRTLGGFPDPAHSIN